MPTPSIALISPSSGETLIGMEDDSAGPRRRLFDLTPDERFAVGADREGRLELWSVDDRACAGSLELADIGEVHAAAFAGDESTILAGTAAGDVLEIAWRR